MGIPRRVLPVAEGGGVHGVGDAYRQAVRCLDIIREALAEHPPTTTMVEVSRLIDPDMLIEIEADAIVTE